MPLAYAKTGETLRIQNIAGGRNLSRRLAEMGLYPGSTIKVISNQGGPIIIAIGETRLAIGKGMAAKIFVG
ncbi:MAG: ferrous iron transport protein A [Synergistetes bacterium]|nr:ferrous iron transport protein A [Synergistota bacterium]